MSRKRRNTSSPEPEDSPSPKRQDVGERHAHPGRVVDKDSLEKSYVDEFSGQVGAFPGLGNDDGKLFYGPASDGIDYLRMVRSERKGVPHVLTLTTAALQDSTAIGGPEDGGWWYDGAYTAARINTTTTEDSVLPPAQSRYYGSLLAQFRAVRATVRCTPPLAAIEQLRSSQLISFPEHTKATTKKWKEHILSADPSPVQIACLDDETVVNLITFLVLESGTILMRYQDEMARFSAWVWSLLGKCRDRDELSSEEISDLRQLTYALYGRLEAGGSTDEEAREHGEVHLGADSVVDAGQAQQDLGNPTYAAADQMQPRMLADTVATIVGEVYGQKDMLELRMRWADG